MKMLHALWTSRNPHTYLLYVDGFTLFTENDL